jgi:hypothetical protein
MFQNQREDNFSDRPSKRFWARPIVETTSRAECV